MEDEARFREEVRTVCQRYHQAAALHEQGMPVISTDEKTGIQALERRHPTRPMAPGKPEAQEFEYVRHGTQALITGFDVATDPEAQWVFIANQLNTHQSAGLVRLIAELCGVGDDLGVKGRSGILKDMDSRADILQDTRHRIRLVYTPKHCSWLNQVEIWFGTLTRRLLK